MIKKIALILVIAMLLICVFAGCGENNANSAIVGKWVGNNEDGVMHSFAFNPDGTGLITIGDNAFKADFTYKQDGENYLITVNEDTLLNASNAPTTIINGSITADDVACMLAPLKLTPLMNAAFRNDTLFITYVHSSPISDSDLTTLTLTKTN